MSVAQTEKKTSSKVKPLPNVDWVAITEKLLQKLRIKHIRGLTLCLPSGQKVKIDFWLPMSCNSCCDELGVIALLVTGKDDGRISALSSKEVLKMFDHMKIFIHEVRVPIKPEALETIVRRTKNAIYTIRERAKSDAKSKL